MSTSQQIINDIEPRSQYVSTNGQTVFNTTWTADSASDIDVYAHADGVEADDATQLVSTTEYNVTFVGTYETVRVTFTTGRVLDDIITIVRNTPSTRDNLYTNTNFTPSMLNQDFGVRTLVEQQNQMYNLDFAPHYNLSCTYTDNSNLNIDIILPILGENQFWVKNLLNTKIIASDLPGPDDLPITGPFITYTESASLANAFDMGLLDDGIVAQTVTASAATPYVLDIPLTVDNGGTGASSFTAFSVLTGGVTATDAITNVSGVGTTGQILTSNGAGTLPTWEAANQVVTIVITTYGTDTTYTKPSNLAYLSIECVGGGGGGGGSTNSAGSGHLISGGGGGGTYSRSLYNADDIGATEAVTIGALGTGGTAGATGSDGGETSFGALCVSPGGSAGTNSPVPGQGGLGGTGNIVSGPGMPGLGGMASSINTTQYAMGGGASTLWGAGGNPSVAGTTLTGKPAGGYGAGGGGGCSSNAGGATSGGDAAPGRIIIIEYLAG